MTATMTADEFRGILDRFKAALQNTEQWAYKHGYVAAGYPASVSDLDQVWRDLDRECAMMKDAERGPETSHSPSFDSVSQICYGKRP